LDLWLVKPTEIGLRCAPARDRLSPLDLLAYDMIWGLGHAAFVDGRSEEADPKRNWKISESDYAERALWDDDIEAFEDVISATSTREVPWYVIPSTHK
jgi:hypothetical protein